MERDTAPTCDDVMTSQIQQVVMTPQGFKLLPLSDQADLIKRFNSASVRLWNICNVSHSPAVWWLLSARCQTEQTHHECYSAEVSLTGCKLIWSSAACLCGSAEAPVCISRMYFFCRQNHNEVICCLIQANQDTGAHKNGNLNICELGLVKDGRRSNTTGCFFNIILRLILVCFTISGWQIPACCWIKWGLWSTQFLICDEEMLSEHPPTRRIITAQIQRRSHGVVHSVVSDKKSIFFFLKAVAWQRAITAYEVTGTFGVKWGSKTWKEEKARGESYWFQMAQVWPQRSVSHTEPSQGFVPASPPQPGGNIFAQQVQMQWSMWEYRTHRV